MHQGRRVRTSPPPPVLQQGAGARVTQIHCLCLSKIISQPLL